MTDATPEQIAAADAYEELHVPALFQEWVHRVLDAAGVGTGQRVLDVACGTGVLARGALTRVGSGGSVVGLDPNPGMLAVAGRLEPGVQWREGAAGALPFEDGTFDAVVSQFGMMFFPDREAAVREMLRVLEPGGSLAVAVWDAIERSPAYSVEVEILERVAGAPAADALRAPFVLGDAEALLETFVAAGAGDVTVSTHNGTASFPTLRAMVEADLRGWLPVMGVHLTEELIDRVLSDAEAEMAFLVDGEGRAVFDSPAHVVRATRTA